MQLALLNTTIATTDGTFRVKTISLADAQFLAYQANDPATGWGILSAVGHEPTAQIMTELLEVPVAVNRIQFAQEAGQAALVFKLKGRAPEGVILGRDEIEKIGYEFKLMERID